ncbi:uncharacterized protein BDCG_17569 [Blastomyces dermatitidis ER-3]|uniref:Uncharacterized protein n=1 Tax=Ajellomyces dermatitidis (strain ER-3 / ATCC MYA-2586) TaxID=559297 RepID=A0ABX2VZ85_AJEDR|nr:uncharacterized protein BDCG_17569 [Blastomyces dermatitidis ER-3]OAT02454.1 hypothetical protein BDCG_17569 [Blastomyces dermatitidis ER-3]
MAVREVRDELDIDKLTDRRDNISLQGTVTITTAAKEVEEEGDMIIEVMLLQLIDTTVSAFNLAFLAVTETAAAS